MYQPRVSKYRMDDGIAVGHSNYHQMHISRADFYKNDYVYCKEIMVMDAVEAKWETVSPVGKASGNDFFQAWEIMKAWILFPTNPDVQKYAARMFRIEIDPLSCPITKEAIFKALRYVGHRAIERAMARGGYTFKNGELPQPKGDIPND